MVSCEFFGEYLYSLLNNSVKEKITLDIRETISSTNTVLKEMAKNGTDDNYVLVSSEQTAGRGRLGRSFHSPEKTGLYMSILLKPVLSAENAVLITTAAAVSVVEALEKCGVNDAKIKWVNDVFRGNKKICGILTEGSVNPETQSLDFAVLGVGINLFKPSYEFPDDIKNIAGYVFSEYDEKIKTEFCAYFLNSFYGYYDNLLNKKYLKEYREKCFVLGKKITVVNGGENCSATAVSIDESARLEVEFENGERAFLGSGEISVKV